ncbi:hypothetical protein KQX54_020491 [Cotesia glomerata]|uniref:Uncharacterized protein n=1 Tax=Cotesia glomerata TaxID=32391 RepID=A0AAV7I4P4_COTGL|nr:hypothetical protein KQX54_020491 [Cotesia glomerata]
MFILLGENICQKKNIKLRQMEMEIKEKISGVLSSRSHSWDQTYSESKECRVELRIYLQSPETVESVKRNHLALLKANLKPTLS